MFIGKDSYGNPMYDNRPFAGDARYTARGEDLDRQYDWNKMEAQNLYNSPTEQLKRLQEAGLNPMFFLGGNAGTTPAASGGGTGSHSMTSASGQLGQVLEAGRNLSDSLLNTQKQALDYDIARRQQNIDLKRVGLEERQTAVQEKQLGINRDVATQNIEESKSRIALNGASVEELASRKGLNEQKTAESKAQEAVLLKKVDEVQATIENLRSATDLNKIKVWEIRSMVPYQLENIAAMTNLSYHQASVEVEKMWNFMVDTEKKQVEVDLGKGQTLLIQRQADGQLYQNIITKSNADWQDDMNQMQVVTGYWQAVNGTIQGAANMVNATSNAMLTAPKRAFYQGAGQKGLFQNNTFTNPIGPYTYSSDWTSFGK